MSQRLNLLYQRISKGKKYKNQLAERTSLSQINVDELRLHMYGQRMSKVLNEFYNFVRQEGNLHIFSHPDVQQFPRDLQRYYQTIQMFRTYKRFPIDVVKDPQFFMEMFYVTTMFHGGFNVKTVLHFMLYMKTLAIFCNLDQPVHRELIQNGTSLKDMGAFALTQVDHGSYVKGLLTTATYNHKTKQFVLNSNGNSGMKFWIGAGMHTANKAIVWAQLIVNENNQGPHPFVVPIRDPTTYQILKGITIGDCGPKNGGNGIDNAFIILKDVKIRKQYFLDKIGKIDSQGNYHSQIKNIDKRFGSHLSPLSSGRSLISFAICGGAANCLATAMRFVNSRRQFQNTQKKQQQLLTDYPLMKHRVCTLLAQNYVFHIGGGQIARIYCKYVNELSDPNSKIANEMHAISSIAKAMGTWNSIDVMSLSRQIMGGHGYSVQGRVGLNAIGYDVCLTFQGDNNLLMQQAARFLLKAGSTSAKTKFVNLDFFESDQIDSWGQKFIQSFDQNENGKKDLDNFQTLKKICQYRVKNYFNLSIQKMQKLKMSGMENIDVWNKSQTYQCRYLSFAYGDLYYFSEVLKYIQRAKGKNFQKGLIICLKLWLLTTLQNEKFGNRHIRSYIQKRITQLCEQLYPDSLKMISAISAPKQLIGSPFARQDGQGMKQYLNSIFTHKNTFKRVDWYQELIKLRQKL